MREQDEELAGLFLLPAGQSRNSFQALCRQGGTRIASHQSGSRSLLVDAQGEAVTLTESIYV